MAVLLACPADLSKLQQLTRRLPRAIQVLPLGALGVEPSEGIRLLYGALKCLCEPEEAHLDLYYGSLRRASCERASCCALKARQTGMDLL